MGIEEKGCPSQNSIYLVSWRLHFLIIEKDLTKEIKT